jgi:tripartite-type tricarboxylate transporter receptor subunit TctC
VFPASRGRKEGAMNRKVLVLGLSVVTVLTFGLAVLANAEYPSKPIQMMVGFRAGGMLDTQARVLAKPLGDILGQPVVVVNKPGGGGGVAPTLLKSAKPDGYTLCLTTATAYSFNTHTLKTEYSLDDFKFLAVVAVGQEAFVSTPDRPWKDFKELVEYAKAHPGMTWASLTPIDKVFLRYIGKLEGIEWNAVPVKGGAGMIPAVLGKQVDFGFSGGIHYTYVKAGKMIVLAGMGKKRLLAFPDIPTLKELGYDAVLEQFITISAPRGISDSIVKKLSQALSDAVKDANYLDLLNNKLHSPPIFLGPDDLEQAIREQSNSYKKMIESLK